MVPPNDTRSIDESLFFSRSWIKDAATLWRSSPFAYAEETVWGFISFNANPWETISQCLPQPSEKGVRTLQYLACTKPQHLASISSGFFFGRFIDQSTVVLVHWWHSPAREVSHPGEKMNQVSTCRSSRRGQSEWSMLEHNENANPVTWDWQTSH